jgi:hypothetical protein
LEKIAYTITQLSFDADTFEIADGSIDESKLTGSVNEGLALGATASRPGHQHNADDIVGLEMGDEVVAHSLLSLPAQLAAFKGETSEALSTIENADLIAASLLSLPAQVKKTAKELDDLELVVSGLGGGHDAVTVTQSDDIELTLSVQDITATLTDSVHEALALGATASRPGHQHPEIEDTALLAAMMSFHPPANPEPEADVTDSPEIEFTLVGDDISASLVEGSISSTKLDVDVNSSLALANTASRPGHGHTTSDLSDFDAAVSNNTSVVAAQALALSALTQQAKIEDTSYAGSLLHLPAQTARIAKDLDVLETTVAGLGGGHVPVTVTDSSEIDFTLVGQDITASLIAGSIDESKLDSSTNNSLDMVRATTSLLHLPAATRQIQKEVEALEARVDALPGGHDAVTVVSSPEIDLALSGQQITATLVSGSIDETKLDASVNLSLDKADNASQPGHTHVAANITNFTTAVNSNANVAANTAARHSAVTKVDTPEIAITLTGQQIAADLRTGSVAASKLDIGVNNSLTLANNASQPGHTHTQSQVTGLVTALAGKAPLSHTHTIDNVTGLKGALASKAPHLHIHGMEATIGLEAALDSKSNNGHLHTTQQVAGLEDRLVTLETASSDVVDISYKSDIGHIHSPYEIAGLDEVVASSPSIVDNGLLAALALTQRPVPIQDDVYPSLLHLPAQTRKIVQEHALLVTEVATLRDEMSALHGSMLQLLAANGALKARINEVELLCL